MVAAFNVPAGIGRWPVVLACRTARYEALAPLQDATAIMSALNESAVDIHLHELWRTTPHPRCIRYLAVATTATAVAVPLLAFFLYLKSTFVFNKPLLGGSCSLAFSPGCWW